MKIKDIINESNDYRERSLAIKLMLTDPVLKNRVMTIVKGVANLQNESYDDIVMDSLKEEYPEAWVKIYNNLRGGDIDHDLSISSAELSRTKPKLYDSMVDKLSGTRAWDKTLDYSVVSQENIRLAARAPVKFIKTIGLEDGYFDEIITDAIEQLRSSA